MDDDTDDKDDSKRKSRNLSEKKRRDQFNLLVNELSSMVSSSSRKMDKSTVLKSTIAFLKHHNEITVRSRVHEIQEDWKPSFLSNEEFTHLILEALDGFIMVFSADGRICYASESITSLLGHLPSDLMNMTIYDLAYEEDHSQLYNVLLNPVPVVEPLQNGLSRENQISFSCHLKRGGLDFRDDIQYELVNFIGYFRSDVDLDNMLTNSRNSCYSAETETRLIFVGTGRIQTPQLIREMSIVDSSKSEFTSRHSLEWKFLFLDHRAPPIIGYLPFEVLGTSGYDYYHFDDLEKVMLCHEALMQKGEGKSCYYRFLTKGQQWIWLQTRFYITYHQWNSKPEFVVCTHRVVSYADVMKQARNNCSNSSSSNGSNNSKDNVESSDNTNEKQLQTSASMIANSPWSSKSSRASRLGLTSVSPNFKSRSRHSTHSNHHDNGSNSTSLSADSPASRHSMVTQYSSRSRMRYNSAHQQKLLAQQQQQQQQQQMNPQAMQASQVHMGTQQVQMHGCQLPPQTMIGSSFIEPPQYLAAIPVQPVIAPAFQATAALISPMQPPTEIIPADVAMTPTQSQIQDQLQRKHEELQKLIVQQQEELRRVSEQLLMARYGILPSIVPITFTNSPTTSRNVISSTSDVTIASQQQHQQQQHHQQQQTPALIPMQLQQSHQQHPSHPVVTNIDHQQRSHRIIDPVDQSPIDSNLIAAPSSEEDEMISYMQLSAVPPAHLSHLRMVSEPHETHSPQQQNLQIPSELEVLPYQLTQEQSQILFNSPNSSRQSQ